MYISKGKYGWYTTARNRNDKDDKQYVNLFFPKHTEPQDGTEQINPIEWTLTCFKGKVGMTIFKYQVGAYASEIEGVPKKDVKDENGKFGNPNVTIESSELPFY